MAGKSQAEWNALHWKWLAEIPWDGNHPIQDRNGSHILRGQSGPVWFLPPANTTQPVTRMISVPHDQILHVFLVGAECSNVEDPPSYGGNEEEMRACAQRYENESSCDVDGVPVTDTAGYITTSPLFNFVLPPVNSFGVSGGGAGQGVAHGANVMIQFSAGSHTVRVRSRYPDVGWSNDVTYVVTVYERPTLAVRPLPAQNVLELSWRPQSGFTLQQASTVDSGWSAPASVISSNLQNGMQSVTVTNSPASRFFRLVRP
jgi:hypothetical protein